MKTTRYFDFRRQSPDRANIRDEWIQRVIAEARHSAVQTDGRIRFWGQVPEVGGKWLRVVVLEDGQTVHNAFFDRDFTGD